MSTLHLKVSGGFAVKLKQEVLLELSALRSWVGTDMLHVHILRLAGSVEKKNANKHLHNTAVKEIKLFTYLLEKQKYVNDSQFSYEGSLLLMRV